jgi:phosphoheptose isomerase
VAEGTMVAYREECRAALNSVDLDAVESVSNALLQARDRGSHNFVVGNGGSAATASYVATDLVLGWSTT